MEPQVSGPVSVDTPTNGGRQDARMASSDPTPKHAAAEPEPPKKWWEGVRDASLWLRDVGLGSSGYIMLVVVVVAGFTASFIGLHDFGVNMMKYSDHQAWLIPTAIDGADIGLSVNALRAAMNGRSAVLNRVMIVACTSISSWINYTHIENQAGKYIASLLPILAVILLESLMGEARKAYERRNHGERPRLSLLRWIFDFQGTKAILKTYVLGKELPKGFAEAAQTIEEEKEKAEELAPQSGPARKVKSRPRIDRPAATAPVPTAQLEETVEMPKVAEEPKHVKPAELVSIDRMPETPEWLDEDMSPTAVMTRLLDENGETPGAVLEKWLTHFGVTDFKPGIGRKTLSRWKANRDSERPRAVGEE